MFTFCVGVVVTVSLPHSLFLYCRALDFLAQKLLKYGSCLLPFYHAVIFKPSLCFVFGKLMPGDVAVVDLALFFLIQVEKERQVDEVNGNKIAASLKGFVLRKVTL